MTFLFLLNKFVGDVSAPVLDMPQRRYTTHGTIGRKLYGQQEITKYNNSRLTATSTPADIERAFHSVKPYATL